ncbi:Cof-type HAD-IIB family hydrolase [Companilactobacillus versmoldensis]|uniref:HAD superfamily hydrolase n=1 Tax=Companilactobacillus versmoldensis DSM 14857 = KCTC 3814 TaxID=1423815 RepID=A0A0R1SF04_9LACO|nr:Cof-type HAD-IIB family hydrolase [Companilactobacillus versmoldensis]KRL68150.1 HAD superfamily hydrolase [Companilactobacillus versmoldensis DSM 14857 = KCTC 3814]
MGYELIAIDLDDTLLDKRKSITPKNKSMIQKALKQGVKVVLCSGRTHNAVIDYAKELDIKGNDQYMITNGGALVETMDQKILTQHTLSNEFYRRFVQFVKQNQLHYNVVDLQAKTYTSPEEWFDKYTIAQAYENNGGLYIREPDQLPSDFEITKAIINGNEAELDAVSPLVHATFDKDYFVVRTGEGFLEVFPRDVNKGRALKELAQSLNIELSKTIAIGDRDNDIPMIKIAGLGIAMENAQPEVKQVADTITTDNNHDGVGNAIEKYLIK